MTILEAIGDVSTQRIVIAGVPRSGKTMLASKLSSADLHHADDYIEQGWSLASALISTRLVMPGPWIWEGVAMGRALRQWLLKYGLATPCDVVVWMPSPYAGGYTKPGQASMATGCITVWDGIKGQLGAIGVRILTYNALTGVVEEG